MTRDEFIDGYMARSKLKPSYRTEDGFRITDCPRRYALPCACGEEICDGWAMVSEEGREDHELFYMHCLTDK